jgi:hypothetical protein
LLSRQTAALADAALTDRTHLPPWLTWRSIQQTGQIRRRILTPSGQRDIDVFICALRELVQVDISRGWV